MALWVLPPKLALQASEVLIPSPLQDRGAPGQGNAPRNLCRQCPTSINSAETFSLISGMLQVHLLTAQPLFKCWDPL